MAINIQRGRDHGLPDYNTARRHMGLEPLESLEPDHFRNVTKSLVGTEVTIQSQTSSNKTVIIIFLNARSAMLGESCLALDLSEDTNPTCETNPYDEGI